MRRSIPLLGAAVLALSPLGTLAAQGAPPTPAKPQAVVLKGKAPVSDKVLDVRLPKPKEGTLANGLHLIVLEDHRTPQVNFTLIIPGAGGYFDTKGALGVASVTATMMREGTPTRSTTQISEALESAAASLFINTGMSSLDATIGGSALTDRLPALMDLTADVLLHPTFPQSEIDKYKQRTTSQLNQQRSIPGFLAQELYQKVMNGDHPASRLSMTADDLAKLDRNALVAWHKERYVPDHAVIAIAGDITYAQAKTLVESRLGSWAKSGMAKPVATDPPAAGPAKVWLVDRPNSVQSNFVVGAPAIERTSPDYDALQLMNAVVGGGPTGRLFTHLREEKGYTYGAYSGLSAGRYKGTWTASTDVRSDVTEPALTDLMAELTAIRDVTVPAKELSDKKRSLIASFALSLESPSQVLNYYVTRWLYDLPADYWEKYPARVMAVTPAQVQSMARKYLDPKKVQIVAVGDGKKIESVMKKFGDLQVFDTEGKKVMGIVP
jgi:predicted Zn-dependent peptidase